jgi:peroxin-11B
LSTNLGRDKTYRALQYFARFYAYHLLTKGNKTDAARWTLLKAHLALARKLMRLGKPMEHAQAALKASNAPGPTLETLTTVGRQIGYFGYLAYDAIVWANAVKFITLKPETAQKVQKTSNRFWFAGLIFSLIHGSIKGARLSSELKQLRSPSYGEKTVSSDADRAVKKQSLYNSQSAMRYQFVQDMLDIWLPASNLGLASVNEGLLGILGLVTSLMALNSQWKAL